jgi:hypothetical protein
MKLFKLFIPKEKSQVVTELESWTVKWTVPTSIQWGEGKTYNKVFIKEEDAKEFKKQLEESASFIKTPIITKIVRN